MLALFDQIENFDGGEGLDVQIWAYLTDGAEHLQKIVEAEVGVDAADDVDFGGALLVCLAGHSDDGGNVVGVFALFAVPAFEAAEFAIEFADVGVVDMAVEAIVDVAAPAGEGLLLGKSADAEEIVGFIEGQAVVEVEPFGAGELFFDAVEKPGRGGFCHGLWHIFSEFRLVENNIICEQYNHSIRNSNGGRFYHIDSVSRNIYFSDKRIRIVPSC